MEDSLFRGSHLKVKRANKHIRELYDLLNGFRETRHYRIRVKRDPKTRDWIISIGILERVSEQVSDDVSVIVGDAIHNLRAALDLAMYELVKWLSRTPSEFTKFPFRKTREEVEAAVKGGTIQGLPTSFKTLVIDIIKPYKGGNDPLYALHTMDIADKHHMLIQTHAVAGLTIKTETPEGDLVNYVTFSTEQSGDMGAVWVPEDVEIKDYDKPVLHVSFGRVEGFESKPILPTLRQLSHLVTEIIEALASECLAQKK